MNLASRAFVFSMTALLAWLRQCNGSPNWHERRACISIFAMTAMKVQSGRWKTLKERVSKFLTCMIINQFLTCLKG